MGKDADIKVISVGKDSINSWTREVKFAYLDEPYSVVLYWTYEDGYTWDFLEGSTDALRRDFRTQEGSDQDLHDFFYKLDELTFDEASKP